MSEERLQPATNLGIVLVFLGITGFFAFLFTHPKKKGIPSSKPATGRTYEGQSNVNYCMECIPPDTKLYTKHSVYPIGHLGERYTVLDCEGQFNVITKKFSRPYDGELIKITPWYVNVPLRLTPEHPILGVKNVRKPQSIWQKTFDGGKPDWIPAGNLTHSDFMAFPRIKETVDVGVVTEDLAELIGWYLAEGSCTSPDNLEKERSYHVEFSLGKHERKYAERIVLLLKSTFGYDANITEKDTALCVQFTSLVYGAFFSQFGLSSSEKTLPYWTLLLPENKQWRILKGMIAGDGDITKESIRYATTSENLAYETRLLLFRLGLLHGINQRLPTKFSIIDQRKIIPKNTLWLFTIAGASANKLAEKIGVNFTAKTNKNWGWITEKYALLPIRKIEKEHYKGLVQNLHVPPNESYVTLQGILHNCIEGHTMIALTELRHALDRYRDSGQMTEGVTEKVQVAIRELMGINEDVGSLDQATPEVREGLNDLLKEVRWLRKEYGFGGRGLTRGYGTREDIEELREKTQAIQQKAYALAEKCPTCKPLSATLIVAQVPDNSFPQDVIEQGITVELEHTQDRGIAKKIAIDHLRENPKYYEYLEKMEAQMTVASATPKILLVSDQCATCKGLVKIISAQTVPRFIVLDIKEPKGSQLVDTLKLTKVPECIVDSASPRICTPDEWKGIF